jgi:hypothetical protein
VTPVTLSPVGRSKGGVMEWCWERILAIDWKFLLILYCLYIIGKQQTKILDMLSDAQFERNYKPLPNENIDPDLR